MLAVETHSELERDCVKLDVLGREILVLSLEALIRVKRAAGRPKDLEAVAELEALLAERERRTE